MLEYSINTQWPPARLPHQQQKQTVQWEEAEQVQQMLESCIILPSSSPGRPLWSWCERRMAICSSASTSDNSTQPPLRMSIPCHALMIYSTPSTAPAGSLHSTLRAATGRCSSAKRINTRQHPEQAVASYSNLTRFHLAYATPLQPSHASWIVFSLILTGRRDSFTCMTSSCSPRHGRNTWSI